MWQQVTVCFATSIPFKYETINQEMINIYLNFIMRVN
jgi:hypothetical protein